MSQLLCAAETVLVALSHAAGRSAAHHPAIDDKVPILLTALMVAAVLVRVVFGTKGAEKPPAEDSQPLLLLPSDDRLPSETERDAGLVKIRGRDPGFSVETLLERAGRVFVAVEKAITRGDVASVRALMTDAAYQQFKARLSLAGVFGVRPAVADVTPTGVRVSALEVAGRHDGAHVGIQFEARRTEVPVGTSAAAALEAASSAPAVAGAEVWSFLRRQGTKTTAAGVIEGLCPSCGAVFQGGETGECAYCHAIVNSGAFDWVLAKISEVDAFSVRGAVAPGLANLVVRDSDCGAEIIENRAVLLFWRTIEALATEDAGRLKKVARPKVTAGLQDRFELDRSDGLREWYRDVQLMSVDLVAVDGDAGASDLAHVRVRWRGEHGLGSRDAPAATRRVERAHVLVLGRRHGARTDQDLGMLTFRCWSCHAPLSDSDSTRCDFCQADQVDDGDHWRLESFESNDLWLARRGQSDTASATELGMFGRQRLFKLMVALARADGQITADEREALEQRGEALGLRPDLIQEGLRDTDLQRADFPKPEEAVPFLAELVELAKADGEVTSDERTFLDRMARSMEATPGDLQHLLDAEAQPVQASSRLGP